MFDSQTGNYMSQNTINTLRNIELKGAEGRPFLLDLYCTLNSQRKPIIIFTHGFKGFKDYGCWDLVAKSFAEKGFVFVKYNFSHNGTTIDHTNDFADLDAFGNNNLSKELFDLGVVIDWIANGDVGIPINELSRREIFLIGHSRGGGTVLLKAAEDERVKKLSTWAGIASFGRYWSDEAGVAEWRKKGVHYVENSRTKQKMPLYFQLYEDYIANESRFSLEKNIPTIKAKGLIVQGMEDEAVIWESANEIADNNANFKKLLIAEMEHGLGGKEPWDKEVLPFHLEYIIERCIQFFRDE